MSDKYANEKRELVEKLEREKDDILKREESKYDAKVSQLKNANDKMSKQLNILDEVQDNF